MNWKFFLSGLLLAAVILSILFIWTPSFLSSESNIYEYADRFIKVDSLSSRVRVVKMGYDAVTAIAAQKGIAIIDAGISNSLTAKYRKIIEQEFKRDDFAYLINTHSHSDHTGGNQVFAECVIVGHENCLSEMKESTKDPVKTKTNLLKIIKGYDKELDTLKTGSKEWKETFCQKMRYQFTYDDLVNDRVVTYPAVTLEDTMNINLGNVSLKLIYFGRAHTNSDILIHIPEEKLLVTGDLFFPGGRPATGEVNKKDVKRWMKVKDWIDNRLDKIETVIGGHGQIMGKSDLESFCEYINNKQAEVL